MKLACRTLVLAGLLACIASSVRAQVSLTTLGSAYTQDFDTLASTGTSSTVPTGWAFAESGTNADTTYAAGTGSSNAGNTYSFGATSAAERAFGGLLSGTLIPTVGASFQNNSGGTITSLDISYTGEQWRVGTLARVDRLDFQYSLDATSLTTGAWTNVDALDFTAPTTTGAIGALNGNAAPNFTAISSSIPTLSIASGATFWIRWNDFNGSGADDGLGVDTFSLTPQGTATPTPNLSINNVTLAEGDALTTSFTFVVSLTSAAGTGGVTFDIATADGTAQDDTPPTEDNDYVPQSLTGQSIPEGSSLFNFTVVVNGDTVVEPNETFLVNVASVVGANVTDGQGLGTINNDDFALSFIHDVQGPGNTTPIPPATTVRVEGVVTADFQLTSQLRGFFLQEELTDHDANPLTSEGIFVFCNSCPTAVAEGQRVRVLGTASEFNGMTELTASTAPAVFVLDAGNNLAEVPPTAIDLPVVGVVDDFYEAREGMRVTFSDTLVVSEYFELARFGQIELYEGGRPRQFTEASLPGAAGYAAHLDNLARRRVILDDDDNAQNSALNSPNGSQSLYYPRANGGLSTGTQGADFFRGGDLVTALTGVLEWSWSGLAGTDAWRIRPTAANPETFTATNLRPATAPAVSGAIQVAGMNLLNYFTTVDTGPDICGPAANQDCRGADSAAELARQRERESIVICALDAHVVAFGELENTTATAAIIDLLGAVNTLCGGADPYVFVSTGSTLGSDAIRVALIYRSASLDPVGSPLVDLDPVHNRPPTAQTFDVIDPANPAFGERFTAIANHFKSKGCGGATGLDLDQGDGQSCFNATRTAQATRLLTWINVTVIPAAGDPDVVLLGDFNSYARENPITTLTAGGYTDTEAALLGAAAYSYLFDGQLGHLDYAFTSASLTPDATGVGAWHINADETPDFDYNDEAATAGEASFEEKPDGSLLSPARFLFEAATPYRAADHDPVLLGLYFVADLSLTKTGAPDPVVAGTNLVYTITVDNAGPNAAANAAWSDTLPAGTTFVSMPPVAGWSCTTPSVGSGGTIDCQRASFPAGSSVFTLTVAVNSAVPAGTILTNSATVDSDAFEGVPGDETGTETTTVSALANRVLTKSDSPDPALAGSPLVYTLTLTNAGPSDAANVGLSDPLPAGTTFSSLDSPGGWICTTPAPGSSGTVSCSIASLPPGVAIFTLTVDIDDTVPGGTLLGNTATSTSTTPDGVPGNEAGTASTTVLSPAAISATKTVSGDTIPGGTIFYEIVLTNSSAQAQGDYAGDEFTDVLPPELDMVGATATSGTVLAVPATNTVTWNGSIAGGGSVTITIEALIPSTTLIDTIIVNQGSIAYDADGNGTNEAPGVTDDPALGGDDDPTAFGVEPGVSILEIPTLGDWGVAAFVLALLGAALLRLWRRPTTG